MNPSSVDTQNSWKMGWQASRQAQERNDLCEKVALAVCIGGVFIAAIGVALVISGTAIPCASLLAPGALLFASACMVCGVAGLAGLYITRINSLSQPSSLHVAAMNGSVLFAKFLLFLGANPNSIALSVNSMTPLHFACLNPPAEGQLEVVRLLIERGADINAVILHNGTMTPLHCAIFQKKVEIVRYLVEHGANLESPAIGSKSPLELAQGLKEKEENPALDTIITILQKAQQMADPS